MMIRDHDSASPQLGLSFSAVTGKLLSWKLKRRLVLTAKDFAEIRAVRAVAFALMLCVPALMANATTQNSTSQAKASNKKHHKSTHASSVVKKASSTSSIPTAKGMRSNSRKKRSSRVRGQQKIDSTRALAIQQALIREHYLNGAATGKWNQTSEDAMRRYQSDHGWQSKTVPDSRALISLGLGPSNDHLLNPESAAISGPNTPRAATLNPVSHSADTAVPASKIPSTIPAPASTSSQDPSSPQK